MVQTRREQAEFAPDPVEVFVTVSVTVCDGKVERAVLDDGEERPEGLREPTDEEVAIADEYVEEKLDTLDEVEFVTYTGEWSWAEAKARTREAFMRRGFNALWKEVELMAKESFERGMREGRRRR